jgi:cytochrome c peroxidase
MFPYLYRRRHNAFQELAHSNNQADTLMFKEQRLRDVGVTPAYFHDGSVATLSEPVRVQASCNWAKT